MDHAEHEDDAVLVDDVVHHAVVASPESVERVGEALDRLDRVAADPTPPRGIVSELLECLRDPGAEIG